MRAVLDELGSAVAMTMPTPAITTPHPSNTRSRLVSRGTTASVRSAATGGTAAARRAELYAASTVTDRATPYPSRTATGLTVKSTSPPGRITEIIDGPSATPAAVPTVPPTRPSTAASAMTADRTWRLRAPTALSKANCRVRRLTSKAKVLAMTNPPTSRAIAANGSMVMRSSCASASDCATAASAKALPVSTW